MITAVPCAFCHQPVKPGETRVSHQAPTHPLADRVEEHYAHRHCVISHQIFCQIFEVDPTAHCLDCGQTFPRITLTKKEHVTNALLTVRIWLASKVYP